MPVPPPLSTPKKASIPKLEYEALEISEVRGPFERKVHYSYFGAPLLKARYFHITTAVGGPLKAK